MSKDLIGNRMKDYYENRSKTFLTRKVPVILRLDGKAFHTYTKGFKRPYDEIFHEAMNNTMKYLCENIQGCKLGYTQSDEISLLLTDYDKITTEAWFNYNVQKMCSVAASMATAVFNDEILCLAMAYSFNHREDKKYTKELMHITDTIAFFDCRAFNVPKEEVTNCFIWRQQDATRNAIQMLGQTYFNHSELNKKSTSDIQDMLMLQKKINFNDMPVPFKRGVCCKKSEYLLKGWNIDLNIPIFTQDRNYIEEVVNTYEK